MPDEFGFGMGEEKPPSPGKQFANILREGPTVGVHLLMWCDSYNNVIRALDRQGLRDVDYRVVFQMNATDSSNLIDTPLASRLGVHRAILYNEGRGTIEKFRPYGVPTDVGEEDQVRELFAGLDRVNLPRKRGAVRTFDASAYDAGTEINDFATSAGNGLFPGLGGGQMGPNQGADENGVVTTVSGDPYPGWKIRSHGRKGPVSGA